MKKAVSFIMALTLFILTTQNTLAHYCNEIIRNRDDSRIEAAIEAISKQKHSVISEEGLIAYIRHFAFNSKYSAFDGKYWPYTNSSGVRDITVDDGTYVSHIGQATGCYAYALFVESVIYGNISTKLYAKGSRGNYRSEDVIDFLTVNAQAGEHIRINSKHSIVFVSCSQDGFYYIDYYTDSCPEINFCYADYDEFTEYLNYGYELFLYNSDPVENVKDVVLSVDGLIDSYTEDEIFHRIYDDRESAMEFTSVNGGTLFEQDDGTYDVSLSVKYIACDTDSMKTEYIVGDEFDSSGIEVFKVYSPLCSKLLTEDEFSISGFNSSEAGTCVITVKYKDFTTSFNVDIKEKSFQIGDVNMDGKIRANDARLALRHSAEIIVLSDEQLKYADFNGDGVVKSSDARHILRVAAELE